ncbi:hypothetical protein Emag_003034 [Eimeria magna]
MEVELCLLQLQRDGGLTVRPVAAGGLLLPSAAVETQKQQQHEQQQDAQQGAAATAAARAATTNHTNETVLIMPLLRRVPGAPLGCWEEERISGSQSLRLRLPACACTDTTSTDLWGPASGLLLLYLLQQQHALQLQQRRVLELGCGLGAPSCLCWFLGAPHVHATDHDAAALCLACVNMRLCCYVKPQIESAAAAACPAAAQDLAAAVARCVEGLHCSKQQQQQQQVAVSELLHALPVAAGASVGSLVWSQDEAAVLQQLQQQQQQPAVLEKTGAPQAGLSDAEDEGAPRGAPKGAPFSLVLAADVLFSDRGAAALACTIKALARHEALEIEESFPAAPQSGKGPPPQGGPLRGPPPFLCLVSHQVRHAVYLQEGDAVKETGDSALRAFLRLFTPQGPLAEAYARRPLRLGGDPTPPPAAAAAADAAAAACELYVQLMASETRETLRGDCCLPEGSTCLLAVASDPELLARLPPPAAAARPSS